MEADQPVDFTVAIPDELVNCICSFMDSTALFRALLVNKKLHAISTKYIDQIPKVMQNPSHIYALVIGPERSGKSSLTTIMTRAGDFTRNARHITTTSAVMPGFQLTFLNTPGGLNKRKQVLKHAVACDLPLLVVNTDPLPQKQEEDLKDLILSTCHVINASNHVIVAVNILEMSNHLQAEAYEQVKQRMTSTLSALGLNMTRVHFVPVNALTGTNARSDLPKFSWYTGPSLHDLFVTFHRQARTDPVAYEVLCKAKAVFQIFEKYFIPGVGAVFCGRVLSGTMKPGYMTMVQPSKVYTTRHSAFESRHMYLNEVKPGFVVGTNAAHYGRRDLHHFKGYGLMALDHNMYPPLHKTLAFRAELSIFAPLKFGPNMYFSLYYSGMRFTCFVMHVVGCENSQSRKILPNLEKDANGSDKIKRQKEAAKGIVRPKKQLLNKATAIIAIREEFPLKVVTNSPFEKHYDGKIVLMNGTSFVAHGTIKKVIDEPAPDSKLGLNFKAAVFDKIMSRASELFVLPQEQTLLDQFTVHEKNSSHRQRVFSDEEEFQTEKRIRLAFK